MLSSNNLKWLKYSNGQWQSKVLPVDFGIDIIRVGDINGDGYDDIVCLANKYDLADGFNQDIGFSYKYSIICLLNDKSGNFTPKTLCPVPELNSIELQDIDNDDDLDVLACGKWGGAGITVWRNLRNLSIPK